MKAPDVLIKELLAKVRRDLYGGKPFDTWAAQQKMVQKALQHPAVCLDKYKIELPAERYQAILEGIIDTIRLEGELSKVKYMSRYFYFCVQEHMKHHGERYYSEGKAINNRVSMFMSSVERAQAGADGTISVLAEADKLLQIGKRKAKVNPKPAIKELDLFSGSPADTK